MVVSELAVPRFCWPSLWSLFRESVASSPFAAPSGGHPSRLELLLLLPSSVVFFYKRSFPPEHLIRRVISLRYLSFFFRKMDTLFPSDCVICDQSQPRASFNLSQIFGLVAVRQFSFPSM